MTLVHRTLRDADGNVTFSEWVEAREEPEKWRPERVALKPAPKWQAAPGIETLPRCRSCDAPMHWRGVWRCEACADKGVGRRYWSERLPRALPREALAGVPLYRRQSGETLPSETIPSQARDERAGAREEAGASPAGQGASGSGAAEGAPIFSSFIRNNSTEASLESPRKTWLAEVEALTSFHRRAVAKRLMDKAFRQGKGWKHWYKVRAEGQSKRFQMVAACGRYEFALEHHGKSVPIRSHCDCWRVCPRCTHRRKTKLQKGMEVQREVIQRLHRRECAQTYRGKEGKWTEKMFTFTVPHGESPASDARCIVDAWQKLLRKVRAHLKQRGAVRRTRSGKLAPVSVPWCRALEVAPRETGGHAHLHVWWVGPFLDVVLLRKWWGDLITESGREVPKRQWGHVKAEGRDRRLHQWLGKPREDDEIPWPVVDVRAEKKNHLASYTQKVGFAFYVGKGSDTQTLSAAHAAALYEVFEGTRAVQWARGWAPPKKNHYQGARLRRLTEKEREELEVTRLSRQKLWQNATIRTQKRVASERALSQPAVPLDDS